ncbi:MAG: hypothetical protein U7123_04445 [Potamolinea sp.]
MPLQLQVAFANCTGEFNQIFATFSFLRSVAIAMAIGKFVTALLTAKAN